MAFLDYDLQHQLQQSKPAKYVRRSSTDKEDKQMRSIEGQDEDLDVDVILKYGLKNVQRYAESQSAFKEGRTQFNELIQQIELGNIDVVIVWHANRIARNYADGGKFVQLLSDKKLKLVVTPYGIYTDSPRDQEYLMNEFTRATRDSGDKSEVVKRGNRTKLKDGYIPSGRLAEGFIHIKNDKDEWINAVDPKRYPHIVKAIKLVLSQQCTPQEALEKLNNEWGYRTWKTKRTGDKPMSDSTWYKILSDPKYFFGEIHRSEGVFNFADDMPQPFTKEDYEKVQILLGSKAARRKTKKDWAFTGLGMICGECNGTVIMEEKWQIICPVCKTKFHKAKDRNSCTGCKTQIADMVNPNILHYTWLRGNHKKLVDGTRCTQHAIAVGHFEEQIDALLAKFTIPESFKDWAIKWLQKEHRNEVKDRTDMKKGLQELDSKVQKQIDELLGLRLRSQIDDAEYEKNKKLLLLEQEQVRRNLQEADKRADNWLELSEKTFNFACYARYWFAHAKNSQQQREILACIGSNLMQKDRILSLYQRKPFKIINGMQEKIDILSYRNFKV